MNEYDLSNVKKDDILVCSWGWEQTNVDFFQVVRATAKSFWVRPISKKMVSAPAAMEAYVEPVKDDFLSDDFCNKIYGKKVIRKLKKNYVEMGKSRGLMTKYDGQAKLETSYA